MKHKIVFGSILFFSACTFMFCALPQASAAIYKYVDKDGNVQYSNVIVPNSGEVVDTIREVDVEPDVAEQRREEKVKRTDSSYERAQKREAKERRKAAKARHKVEEERRRRGEKEKQLKQKIRVEKKHIVEQEKSWLARCESLKAGFLVIQECREKVKKRTKKDLRTLRRQGESYFAHMFSNQRSSENHFESLLESYEKKSKKSKKNRRYETK